MIEFIEMTFPGGPREVRRIIVRSVTDLQVHKLSEGKFTFYSGIYESGQYAITLLHTISFIHSILFR